MPALGCRKVNQLLQPVERTCEKVSNDPADATNNATERLIRLTLEIRAKTVRGLGPCTRYWLIRIWPAGDDQGRCDLRNVV